MQNQIIDEIGISIIDYSFIENDENPKWFKENNDRCLTYRGEANWDEKNAKEALEEGKNWEDWAYDSTQENYWKAFDYESLINAEY